MMMVMTPDDYEPPGFEPSTQVKFSFPRDTLNIKLDTNFFLKTTMHKQIMPQNDSEEPISLNALEENAYAKETIHDDISKEELFESQHSSQESLIRQLSKDMKTIAGLKCPCKSKMAGYNDTIVCTSCEWLQHKVCYGILMPDDAPQIFYCTDCIIHNTDEDIFQELIYTYQGKECQVEFCAIRRAINLCLSSKTVTHAMFEKILGYSKTMAKILIQRLEFEGFIRQISNTEKYAVESTNLMNYGLPNYFPETNRKNDQVLMQEDSEVKKKLSLTSKSPNQENIQNARKRKVSRKILSNELETEDAFPSQKRRRSTRKSLITTD
ncbi:hypothetical protein CEXT_121761 [Caerostris extrusa]|uniref:HORMA domain-containing protein n=1 Tax=Caerostris extrusa TaxID=172846 RepID=A0AAV4NAB7_CAEEX|nr:hypothetical protein CEXT_121761 [Caerostris extrusa]